jgi:hypothetical protein
LIPTEAAEAYMDKHVSKILLEAVQMLCTAMRVLVPDTPIKDQIYKVAHLNHPVSIWVRTSRDNFIWTLDLVEALHEEWRFRYDHPIDKFHHSYAVAQLIRSHVPRDELFPCPRAGLTPFALAMPDEYKTQNAVESYRAYYMSPENGVLPPGKSTDPRPNGIPIWIQRIKTIQPKHQTKRKNQTK